MQPGEEQTNQQQQQQDGARRGEPGHLGGASKDGHLRPDNDATDETGKGSDGQIAQNQQQSSGQGSGQS